MHVCASLHAFMWWHFVLKTRYNTLNQGTSGCFSLPLYKLIPFDYGKKE